VQTEHFAGELVECLYQLEICLVALPLFITSTLINLSKHRGIIRFFYGKIIT
jgi:hypothetical protein